MLPGTPSSRSCASFADATYCPRKVLPAKKAHGRRFFTRRPLAAGPQKQKPPGPEAWFASRRRVFPLEGRAGSAQAGGWALSEGRVYSRNFRPRVFLAAGSFYSSDLSHPRRKRAADYAGFQGAWPLAGGGTFFYRSCLYRMDCRKVSRSMNFTSAPRGMPWARRETRMFGYCRLSRSRR